MSASRFLPPAAAAAPRAGSRQPVERTGPRAPLPVQSLQRSAGNRAVGAMLQRQEEESAGDQVRAVLRSGGAPLDAAFRTRAEQFLGADLSHVRVHTSGAAAESARAVGAHAYTSGADVVFGSGMYDTSSTAGQHRLAHELTHVVQQQRGPVAGTATAGGLSVSDPSDRFEREAERAGAAFAAGDGGGDRIGEARSGPSGGPARVQREIGFEFEDPRLLLWEAQDTQHVPQRALRDAGEFAVLDGQEKHRLSKGQASTVLRHQHFEVQADDHPASSEWSDPEIVTDHFAETDLGRSELDAALTAMNVMNATLMNQGAMRGVPVAALAGGDLQVGKSGAWMYGDLMHGFHSKPQVTMGLGLAGVTNIVRNLHGHEGEDVADRRDRAKGRLMLRDPAAGRPNTPQEPGETSEAATLVRAAGLARTALATYRAARPDDPVHDGPAMEGLLTMIYAYRESAPRKSSFLKSHSPLLAKTDFATIWRTLPPNVRGYYEARAGRFTRTLRIEVLVASAPGYDKRMDKGVFAESSALPQEDAIGQAGWYRRLTLRKWVRGMVSGTDELTTQVLQMRGRIRPLESLEGFAALGGKMDPEPGGDVAANPVFELRSATRLMSLADFHGWALGMFDYIRSVNENKERLIGQRGYSD